ncbi:MAG: hypothetical protein AB7U83_09775 [Vicinamibacterales bacterium]
MASAHGTRRDPRPFDPAELSRVFTVQLRDVPGAPDALAGRLTHAATAAASHFDSAEELVAQLRAAGIRLRRTSAGE